MSAFGAQLLPEREIFAILYPVILYRKAAESLPFSGNRKRILSVLLLLPLLFGAVAASAAEEPSVSFVSPSDAGSIKKLTDGSVRSFIKAKDGITVTFGDDARQLYVSFEDRPADLTLTFTDAAGGIVSEETVASPILNHAYPIPENAVGAELSTSDELLTVAELHVYGERLPAGVTSFEPSLTECDLLVVSAHCDDEELYFGGTIPYYAGEQGLAVQLAYMAHGKRLRQEEAMNGIALCGVTNEPVFVGLRDKYSESLEDASRAWGYDDTVLALVRLIRRTRPLVIVSHDLEGEYGHGAHRLTAHALFDAVPYAADASFDAESVASDGVWSVRKLYLHLYPENRITMNWRKPLDAFGGYTALDMANEAYLCHESQLDYHTAVHDSGDYSCAEFGLAFTTVGQDGAKDDFFEHIDEAELSNYVAPTPSPSPEPTVTPAPTPSHKATPAPTAALSEADALTAEEEAAYWGSVRAGRRSVLFVTAIAFLPFVVLAAVLLNRKSKKK